MPERDKPDNKSGVSQIKATPEMLAAGKSALLQWYGNAPGERDFIEEAVTDVFRAMVEASGGTGAS